MWDYRIRTLFEKFQGHYGPVRGLCFHNQQPIFVSGGDDYKIKDTYFFNFGTCFGCMLGRRLKIGVRRTPETCTKIEKVWNYKLHRCVFTLLGHLDYIRSTFFHHEYPWILSASDDQTIRIWNWQSRTCIYVLTGHTYYVMCAQFHPTKDIIVSASLDATVRIWNFSGLRNKYVSPGPQITDDMVNTSGTDLFSMPDAFLQHVLESHDHGVNWACFHPTLPLIVSGSDDRLIKVYRMNGNEVWDENTFRGHYNNISCVLFHPRQQLILSNSEDKSIRVWDMVTLTCVHTFRRERDRFWALAVHPTINMIAAGHDSGMVMFKLAKERPAYTVVSNMLFYIRDRLLRKVDFTTGTDTPVMMIGYPGNLPVYSIGYNVAEGALLVTIRTRKLEQSIYWLYMIPKNSSEDDTKSLPKNGKTSPGMTTIWVARNRFAVLERTCKLPKAIPVLTRVTNPDGSQSSKKKLVWHDHHMHGLVIKDLENKLTKKIDQPNCDEIFYAGTGMLLLREPEDISMFDLQQQRVVAQVKIPKCRFVIWSADMNSVAMITKRTVNLCNRKLQILCSYFETRSIKSGAWDESGVFIYSTSSHLKYSITTGDHGTIRTLDLTIYITKVKGNQVFCIDRECRPRVLNIDPTEYKFKLALINRKYDEVLHMVRNARLVGQSIIAYLQQQGYSEVCLHFVKDEKTRFSLALECGNIEVALASARALGDKNCWEKLSQAALMQGNHQIVEMCYQRTNNFDKLSFLYLITGSLDKLRKMTKIAEIRKDFSAQYQDALFLGDVAERIRILKNCRQYSLAYLTAVAHGLHKEAEIIKQSFGNGCKLLQVRNDAFLLKAPVPIMPAESNWPLLTVSKGFFDSELLGSSSLHTSTADLEAGGDTGWNTDTEFGVDDQIPGEEHLDEFATSVENGWENEDLQLPPYLADSAEESYIIPRKGVPQCQIWKSKQDWAAYHVMSGFFETAFHHLHEQIGVVNFIPFKELFLTAFSQSWTSSSLFPSMPPMLIWPPSESCLVQSGCVKLSDQILKLQHSYRLVSIGKFKEAIEILRNILLNLPLLIVNTQQSHVESQNLLQICRDYILGLQMDIARKQLPKSEEIRNCELAAYFTHCNLQPAHQLLALRIAFNRFFKIKNYKTGASFAVRLLGLCPQPDIGRKVQIMLQACRKNPVDECLLNYNENNPFSICGISYIPINKGGVEEKCPFCSASYLPQHKGKLCRICLVSEIGKNKKGLPFPRI